jgi:hypothetical protein
LIGFPQGGVPLDTRRASGIEHRTSRLLLGNEKTNQLRFGKFLFHLIEVAVSIDFARKKNLFLTGFAHRKFVLWKSCELDL